MDTHQGLQMEDNLKTIVSTWIAVQPKPTQKTLGRYLGSLGQLSTTDSCIENQDSKDATEAKP
jgi:hypothetical protein